MRWAKDSARFFAFCLASPRWHTQRVPWFILMQPQQWCAPVGSRSTCCDNVVPMLLQRLTSPPLASLSAKGSRTSGNWWRDLRPRLWPNFGRARQIKRMPAAFAIKQGLGPHRLSSISSSTSGKRNPGRTGCYASLQPRQTGPFGIASKQRGAVSLLLLSCGCLMVCICAITMWAWIIKAAQHHLALFDDERSSPLYCRGSLAHSFDKYAPGNKSINAFALQVPCVLGRTDYAAPGASLERAPEILCWLLKRMELSTADLSDAGVGPCA